MRKLFTLFTVAIVVLTACQKEVSLEDPDAKPGTGPGGPTGTRLIRTGTRMGADSITMDFTYNAANLISNIAYKGTANAIPFTLQQKVNRNGANIITSVVLRSPLYLLAGFKTDSLVTVYTYSGGRYTHGILKYVLDDEPLVDSVYFTYDGVGKLLSHTTYVSDGTSGYFPSQKSEYTYAGNNLLSVKGYYHDGFGFTLEETQTFEYDDKRNPMLHPAEAQILGMADFYSANNKTKRTVATVDPPETEEATISYTYNNNNYPVKGVATSANSSSTTTYFYQ